jgi:hypothetical protein
MYMHVCAYIYIYTYTYIHMCALHAPMFCLNMSNEYARLHNSQLTCQLEYNRGQYLPCVCGQQSSYRYPVCMHSTEYVCVRDNMQ